MFHDDDYIDDVDDDFVDDSSLRMICAGDHDNGRDDSDDSGDGYDGDDYDDCDK